MKTYANGRSVLNQGDGHTQTAAAPDVCKTPSPGGPVPVPYVNVARDSDLAEGSTSVEIEGHPVALKGSYLRQRDEITHSSDREEFLMFLVLSTSIPFS